MKIAWISGRDVEKDLAATTEINLAKSLAFSGSEVTLFTPGSILAEGFKHEQIRKIGFPGLNSISGARNISHRLFSRDGIVNDYDVLLVDWRYVRSLRVFLKRLELPWIIIDRGPPAFKGLLNRLQKIYWSSGWEIASEFAAGGFVVSKKHSEFVRGINNVEIHLHEIPAGTIPNPFLGQNPKSANVLKLAYVGSLDERRGIQSILELSEKMIRSGVKHSITLAGDGDMRDDIEVLAANNEFLEFPGKIGRNEVRRLLARCHIGIMPMPKIPIWRISSPLKLPEYLASGMAIIGPKHTGNDLGLEGQWNRLGGSEDWVDLAISDIGSILSNFSKIEESAIVQSKKFHWDSIASEMMVCIENML